jgi:hypothetical protein
MSAAADCSLVTVNVCWYLFSFSKEKLCEEDSSDLLEEQGESVNLVF